LLPSCGKVAAARLWSALSQLGAGEDLLELYQLAYALFLPAFQRELLRPDLRRDLVSPDVRHGLPLPLVDRLSTELHGRSPLSAISLLEQRLFLGERLLRDTDAASMAASLELRVPLVDHALFEVVDRLPDLARYAPLGRKQALRELGHEGLDPALFERPKRGFVLPFDRWIRRGLGRAMDETMRDPAAARAVGLDGGCVARLWDAFQQEAPGMYWSRVWSIYALMRWCDRHGVTV
jgi:asparagine synthase (glutamine-hydrolysing)